MPVYLFNMSNKGRGHKLWKCISDHVSNCEDLKRSLYLEDEASAFLRSIYSVTNEHLSNIKCRLNKMLF